MECDDDARRDGHPLSVWVNGILGTVIELHVLIPDDVAERLADRAEREQTTSEELVTDAVTKLVGPAPQPASGKLGIIGLGDSGRSDISELSTTMEFGFIGVGQAKPGFSARAAEERLEAEGFV
jgi:hypothetical protein